MCGIAGELRFDAREADLSALARMNVRQAPRGPDGQGVFATAGKAFGHRRLKIMDLSDAAQQPMVDPHLGLGIVFNGAIYNHPELRKELKALGYRFFFARRHRGTPQGLPRLGAGFRPAAQRHVCLCALGARFGQGAAGARPAGHQAAVLGRGGGRCALCLRLAGAACGRRHRYRHRPGGPAPLLVLPCRGAGAAHPAARREEAAARHADGDRARWSAQRKIFWALDYARTTEEENRSFDDWRDILLQSLRAAVRRRLVADVPVGALLSGGVDSSLIVGLMAEAGVPNLRTYNVGFEDVGGEKGNEFEYAEIVAQSFGTIHERIFVPEAELLRRLPEAIAAMSEPMVSHDCIGFYLLSEAVSRHSKVVQSGQGADEVFGGYHWYPALAGSRQPVDDYLAAFRDRGPAEYGAHRAGALRHGGRLACAGGRAVCCPRCERPGRAGAAPRYHGDAGGRPGQARGQHDHGLWPGSARTFLDHELVELAARIPARHKLAGGGKGILKEAARKVIPAAVIDRPKGYFPVPALKYLQGNVLANVKDALGSRAAQERGLFQRVYVDELLADPGAHITPLRGSKLWQLGLLEMWLQTHLA